MEANGINDEDSRGEETNSWHRPGKCAKRRGSYRARSPEYSRGARERPPADTPKPTPLLCKDTFDALLCDLSDSLGSSAEPLSPRDQ